METRDAYLDALGVTQWLPRVPAAPVEQAAQAAAVTAGATATGTVHWLLIDGHAGDPAQRISADFSGEVGQLMLAMLRAVQLAPEQVRVVAPGPGLAEVVAALRPRLLLALGETAARAVADSHEPLDGLRGQLRHWGSARTPLVASYHPAQLLREPAHKRKAWEDLKLARASTTQVEAG